MRQFYDSGRAVVALWIRFGEKIGDVMAIVVLTVVYWFVIGPLALLAKLVGADFLRLKSKNDSYWLKPDEIKNQHDIEKLTLPF